MSVGGAVCKLFFAKSTVFVNFSLHSARVSTTGRGGVVVKMSKNFGGLGVIFARLPKFISFSYLKLEKV